MILRRISLLGDTCEKPEYIAPVAKSLTYNGDSQELLIAGSTNDGTIYYSLDNSTWSEGVPSGTNAGSYTVYWKLVGDEGYCDVAAQSIQCSINEKQVTATVTLSQTVYTYNGSACEPSVTVSDGDVVIDSSEYTVTYSNNINAGTGTVTISDNVGGNYDVVGSSTFTINKVTPTVVAPTAKVLTYNGTAQALVNAGSTDYGTLKYSTDGSTYSTSIPSGTNATSYTVYYKVDGDNNINDIAPNTVNVTISKSDSSLSFVVTDITVVVGGTKSNVVTVNAGDGTVTYSSNNTSAVTVDNNGSITGVSVGNAVITANISSTSNYNSASTSYTSSCVEVITAKFNVTRTSSPTKILSNTTNISEVYVDGVKRPSVTTGYTFFTTGTHTVKYILADKTSIGERTFRDCSGLTSIDIPDSVTSIGAYAFNSCENLSSCTIGDNITSIGDDAFQYCTGLTRLNSNVDGVFNIPSGVTSINVAVFHNCTGLTSIEIPSGVTSIGDSAFLGCRNLTSITIPDSVTSIGNYAFEYCSGMTSCTIGSGITSIGNSAFTYCSGLTSIIFEATTPPTLGTDALYRTNDCPIYVPTCSLISTYQSASGWSSYSSRIVALDCEPVIVKYNVTSTSSPTQIGYSSYTSGFSSIEIDGVEQSSVVSAYTFSTTGEHTVKYTLKRPLIIGNNSFQNCVAIKSVTIPNTITSIGTSAFYGCSGLTSVDIPDNVTGIGTSVFVNCSGLTSITIGSGITTIGNTVFSGCKGLTAITINATTPPSLGSETFSYDSGCNIYVPTCSLVSTYQTVWGRYTTRIVSLDCSQLINKYNVTTTSGPTQIGYVTSGFRAIEIDGVEQSSVVSAYTFSTTGEHTVKYYLKGPEISSRALYGCTNLISVGIPDDVESIGDNAFGNCRSLTSITVDANNTNYSSEDGVLFNKTKTTLIQYPIGNTRTSYDMPNSVTSIGNCAFSGCTSLTSIDVPSGVTSIGNYAFYNCSGLTSIEIPSGVTSIGKYAFYYCSGLTSIEIPDGVTTIGEYTFYNCSGLTSIEIPDGVTTIDSYAFGYCRSLTSITIPDSLTSIGNGAFYECSSLTSVTIPSGVTKISDYAFRGCSGLTSITIPSSVTSIGTYAFYKCSGLTSIASNATTAPTIYYTTFRDIKTGGTLTVSIGSSGYDVWMGTSSYYLGLYNWTKVEQ